MSAIHFEPGGREFSSRLPTLGSYIRSAPSTRTSSPWHRSSLKKSLCRTTAQAYLSGLCVEHKTAVCYETGTASGFFSLAVQTVLNLPGFNPEMNTRVGLQSFLTPKLGRLCELSPAHPWTQPYAPLGTLYRGSARLVSYTIGEWTLNALLTKSSSLRKCSKRRISGH